MIHLTWDWGVFSGIVLSGLLSGFFLGPAAWPVRAAARQRPPILLAVAISISAWFSFFGALTVFRIVAGQTAELQAAVLNLVFILTGGVGLGLRSAFVRP